ncbi:hypothetical protein CC86DRAFT_399438 [Ophiobolus disseminans]|uniref:N-acetyltransferase domain-containing protein n=1 Tax=Ophiobolus disseminans TaxID=1469910 RepID=A0A6A7AIK3_9PLEO|nr:hypothetical protein CC86DRAFT_399438 [Ophiobolus disseminans]
MPLELHPITPSDTLSWTRIRALAYRGPTHDFLHNGPIRESSIVAVAEDRKRNLTKPNTWHWKIVDTELAPSADDPPDNGGRTIAISVWSMCNVPKEEGASVDVKVEVNTPPPFFPPELRIDALTSLFAPLRSAQAEIMGTSEPYFMLNSLATHPEQQGRGAASVMLDWGLREADLRGLRTYLDATSVARSVYERRGFWVVRSVEWDRRCWGGEGRDVHFCMVREVGGRDR